MTIVEKQFEKFYKKIKLTKKQRLDAEKKYNGVCKKLHDHYYEEKYTGHTKLLFGSYGKKTNIRPPRDVDVLFEMPQEEFDKYNNYESNGQSQLLQDVRVLLSEKYSTTEKIRAWGKVVLVEFSDGKHNIELLPAFEQEDESFLIPNTEDGGKWESFYPKPEMDELAEKDQELAGLLRKMIRMIKKWNENTSVDLKSYKIEHWMMEFFDLEEGWDSKSTPNLVKSFFSFLLDNIEDDYKSHVETAYSRATKAVDYEEKKKEEDAVGEWIKIFGEDFPKNFDKQASSLRLNSQIATLRKQYPSKQEEFLKSKYGYVIEINSNYNFKIDAEVTQDGFRPRVLSFFLEKGWALKKEKSLVFSVIENSIPEPYTIFWKVRNYGEEADVKGQLRGEITPDKGNRKKTETTRFKGEHYVECYCIKDNVCVATDNILVPIGNA